MIHSEMLNPVTKDPAKIVNIYRKFAKQLNFNNVKFPVSEKDYTNVEKQNNISINVLVYKNKTRCLIYTSKCF